MFISTTITESLPDMRREYRLLREVMDPHAACNQLAKHYHCAVDQARMLIGRLNNLRICRNCWADYVHLRIDGRHLCDECMAEERALHNARYQEDLQGRRLHPTKFLDAEESVERTIIMLTLEYGMNREEALRYIGDLQMENAIIPRSMLEDGEYFIS